MNKELLDIVLDENIINIVLDIVDAMKIYWFDYCGYYDTDTNKPVMIEYKSEIYYVYGCMNKNSNGEYIDFQGIQKVYKLKHQ